MAETYLIEVREGLGEPGFIELRPGVELAPLGVGTEGAWRVRGAGVLGVHLYLYFDGQALFAQSADGTKPAVVNGRTVGVTWTPLTAPATIALGTARLFFRPNADPSERDSDRTIAQAPPSDAVEDAADEDRTVAVAPPVRTSAPVRPFQPGAFSSRSDESTRFAPMGDDGPDSEATRIVPLAEGLPPSETPELGTPAVRAMGPAAAVRPAAGVPWSAPDAPPRPGGLTGNIPPLVQRTTSPDFERQRDSGDVPGQGPTLHRPMDGQEPAGPFPRPPAGYPGDPGPSSLEPAPPTPLGPPPGLINIPPPQPAAPSAKKESRLGREWRAAPLVRKILYVMLLPALGGAFWVIFSGNEPPPAQPKPKPAPSADAAPAKSSPTGPTPPPDSAAPPASAPPSTPPSTPAAPNPPPTTPPRQAADSAAPAAPSDGGAAVDRRERMAADYVSTGQYDSAAQLYDSLAQDNPKNPAFSEAARILRTKLEAGVR